MKKPAGYSIVSVDPGTSTGLAWVCIGRKEIKSLGAVGAMKAAKEDGRLVGEQVDSGTEYDSAAYVLAWIEVWGREAARKTRGRVSLHSQVVIEDFILREHTKDRSLLAPVRLTAMIEFGLWAFGRPSTLPPAVVGPTIEIPVTRQQPSDAKSVATDERLKRWGLWHPGSPHVRDAIKHLVVYLRRNEAAMASGEYDGLSF